MNTQKAQKNDVATHADYANADFKAEMSMEQALKFGSDVLLQECVTFRLASIMLTKSKAELLEGIAIFPRATRLDIRWFLALSINCML